MPSGVLNYHDFYDCRCWLILINIICYFR